MDPLSASEEHERRNPPIRTSDRVALDSVQQLNVFKKAIQLGRQQVESKNAGTTSEPPCCIAHNVAVAVTPQTRRRRGCHVPHSFPLWIRIMKPESTSSTLLYREARAAQALRCQKPGLLLNQLSPHRHKKFTVHVLALLKTSSRQPPIQITFGMFCKRTCSVILQLAAVYQCECTTDPRTRTNVKRICTAPACLQCTRWDAHDHI